MQAHLVAGKMVELDGDPQLADRAFKIVRPPINFTLFIRNGCGHQQL